MQARVRRLAATAAAATAAVGTGAIPAAIGAAQPGSADELRREHAALESRSASARLELFALESRLASARADAAAASARAERLREAHARLAKRVAVARRNADVAELLLADRLRSLYESRDVHPLSVLLGAETLDDALARIDALRLAAEQDVQILDETRRTRQALAAAERRLAERKAAADAAADAARGGAAALERTRAELAAYLDRLAAERELRASQLEALRREARSAQAAAQELANAATSPATAPVQSPEAGAAEAAASEPAEAAVTGPRTLTVTTTGYALTGATATGVPAGHGVVAVDPAVIPLGARLTIPGYGAGVAADVGGRVRGHAIDLWFPSRAEALRWGRRTLTITIHDQ